MSDTPFTPDILDLLPQFLSDSEHVKSRLEARFTDLVDLTFDLLEEQLTIGTPADQQAILKMILPLLLRVKKETEVSGEDVQEGQREMRAMLAEMGQELGSIEEVPDDGET